MLAFLNEDRDDSERPILGLMNKVHFHREVVSIHRMFAGRVEVELLE